jgi:hypothetical protein
MVKQTDTSHVQMVTLEGMHEKSQIIQHAREETSWDRLGDAGRILTNGIKVCVGNIKWADVNSPYQHTSW